MKKDISLLKKNRSIFLKVGLALALAIVIYAMNYTKADTGVTKNNYAAFASLDEDILLVPPPTSNKPVSPPPPVIEEVETIDIDEPELEFVEEPILPVSPVHIKTTPKEPIGWTGEAKQDIDLPEPPPPALPIVIEEEAKPLIFAEVMPHFAINEENLTKAEIKKKSEAALMKYIYSNIKYPSIARDMSIEGSVVVGFIIEKDGSITNATIKRGIGGGCGEEVLKLIEAMPNWVPGKQNARPVRVQFNLPVKFKLSH